jgi:putative Holliday junction resolvase
MRILAIDHGEKRIGVAISDETATIARPLAIVRHISRTTDARRVLDLAQEHRAGVIVIGESSDEEGALNLAGRRAVRFADALKAMTELRIVLWDESLSTRDAREWRAAGGASRKRRGAALDAEAAAMILQSYLEALKAADVGRKA